MIISFYKTVNRIRLWPFLNEISNIEVTAVEFCIFFCMKTFYNFSSITLNKLEKYIPLNPLSVITPFWKSNFTIFADKTFIIILFFIQTRFCNNPSKNCSNDMKFYKILELVKLTCYKNFKQCSLCLYRTLNFQ